MIFFPAAQIEQGPLSRRRFHEMEERIAKINEIQYPEKMAAVLNSLKKQCRGSYWKNHSWIRFGAVISPILGS
jgi:hypothetical protein